MKKKLFTLIAMLLPMMVSAYEVGNSLNLYSWEGMAEEFSDDSSSDVSRTRGVGDVNITVVLQNISNEDIYITGHMYISVITADGSDWAPINIDIYPVSNGCAGYRIPAGQTARVTPDQLNITVASNTPGEVVSKYLGGTLWPEVYWRVFSWTSAHDPAVVKTRCGSTHFVNGGTLVFILTHTDQAKEGRIVPCPNAITLGGGSIQPEPQQPEPQQPEPQQPEPQQPEPQPVLQCEMPTISYNTDTGELSFSSATSGATIDYEIYTWGFEPKMDLKEPRTLTVTAIAKKGGYIDSEYNYEEITVEGIKVGEGLKGDLTGDGVVNVADHVKLSDIIMKLNNTTSEEETPQASGICEKPTIAYENGELTLSSPTSGVSYYYKIYTTGNESKVDLKQPRTLNVMALAETKDFLSERSDDLIEIEGVIIGGGVRGDLTGDGKVDDADHAKLSDIILEQEALEEQEVQQEKESQENQEQ